MPTNFIPEPGGVEIEAVEQVAASGSSEEQPRTLAELLAEYPEEDATQVAEDLEYEDDRVVKEVRGPVSMPTTINLFQHPDAHPYVLDIALLRKYGPEWMVWEPEVLEQKILLDFRTRSISDLNMDKIQALKTLHLVDTFWSEWLVFVPCAMALSGVPADFRVLNALTVPQAMIAVDVASMLRTDLEYSLEVRTFLEVVFLHDGMTCPLPPLDFVTVDADRFDVDCKRIREAWPEVLRTGTAPDEETVEAVQLQRMLQAHQLLKESRQQLESQLPLVYHD